MFADVSSLNVWNLENLISKKNNGSVSLSLQPFKLSNKRLEENSQLYHIQSLLQESLEKAREKGSRENWDEEGALPTNKESYYYMKKLLLLFPPELVPPIVYPDPDGSLGLDWDNLDGTNITVVMMPSGEIAYSIYGNKESSFGKINWDFKAFPKRLKEILLFYA